MYKVEFGADITTATYQFNHTPQEIQDNPGPFIMDLMNRTIESDKILSKLEQKMDKNEHEQIEIQSRYYTYVERAPRRAPKRNSYMVDMGKDLSTAFYVNDALQNNPATAINGMSNRLYKLKHDMTILTAEMSKYETLHGNLTTELNNLNIPPNANPSETKPEPAESETKEPDFSEFYRHTPTRNGWNVSDIKPNLPAYVNYLSDIIHELEFACNLLQQRQAGYVDSYQRIKNYVANLKKESSRR